jgi:bacterioferritin-associated ferredoxin
LSKSVTIGTYTPMIVCHCKGITDRDIRKAVLEGASTCTDVERHCEAGTECGGCRPLIEQIVGVEAATPPSEPQQRTS